MLSMPVPRVGRADGALTSGSVQALDFGPLEGTGFLRASVTHQRPSQYLLWVFSVPQKCIRRFHISVGLMKDEVAR